MTYASELAALSRTPVTYAKMTLDYCSRTFGVSPCIPAADAATPDYVDGGEFSDAGDVAFWVGQDCTLDSIVGGQAGSCLELTRTGGSEQYALSTIQTGVAEGNVVTVYVKSGTSGNEAFEISAWDADGIRRAYIAGTSSGSWVRYDLPVPGYENLNLRLIKKTNTAGTMLFDSVRMTQVAPCYNTYHTCRYRTSFSKTTKDYKFTSADAAIPFEAGERPYIKSVRYMPTEIKDSLTVTARVTLELYDEPDTDVGIDPYYNIRPSVQGTFWKKLLARNPNYKGRYVSIYEGFPSLDEGDFVQKFVGTIDNVTMGRGAVKIEVVDLLKALEKIDIPAKLDVKLAIDINDSVAQMTLDGDDLASLDDPLGYVRIGDEIIKYEAINTTTGIISTCTRGVFSTTAAAHSAKDKMQKVRYYAADNPFDLMETILTDAGVAAGYIDSEAFTDCQDWPGGDLNMSAVISEPTKASDLYFELVDLLGCKSWVGEDLKITIARETPNRPGRSYTAFTDDENIILNSPSVDLNQASLITRCSIYWDKATIADDEEPASYARLDLAIDSDAEGANEYNEKVEKKIFCRWIQTGLAEEGLLADYVKALAIRLVYLHRDPMPLLSFDAELKNSGIATGDYAKITTDELLDIDGDELAAVPFQIVKREQKGNVISLKALRMMDRRILCVAPTATPVYGAATAAQREYGYICDGTDERMTDDSGPYIIW